MKKDNEGFSIPFWEKYFPTINEVSAYFHIGDKKLRQINADDPYADYFLKVGNRQMIKRKRFEQFLDRQEAV